MPASPSHAVPLPARRSLRAAGENEVRDGESAGLLALILALLTVGETRIEGLAESPGVLTTAEACRSLGATIERVGGDNWRIHGVGVGGLLSPEGRLDFEGAETAAIAMMGVVATHGVTASFGGDLTPPSRPTSHVLVLLAKMGAEIITTTDGTGLVYTVRGTVDPAPIAWSMPDDADSPSGPLEQAAMAALLAGLNAPGETTVTVPRATSGNAEYLFRLFGANIATSPEGAGRRIVLQGRPTLRPAAIILSAEIPPPADV